MVLTFIVVVLHCYYTSSGCSSVVYDGFGVQGFDGEWINHTDVDSLWGRRELGEYVPNPTECYYEKAYFSFKHNIMKKNYEAQ